MKEKITTTLNKKIVAQLRHQSFLEKKPINQLIEQACLDYLNTHGNQAIYVWTQQNLDDIIKYMTKRFNCEILVKQHNTIILTYLDTTFSLELTQNLKHIIINQQNYPENYEQNKSIIKFVLQTLHTELTKTKITPEQERL